MSTTAVAEGRRRPQHGRRQLHVAEPKIVRLGCQRCALERARINHNPWEDR